MTVSVVVLAGTVFWWRATWPARRVARAEAATRAGRHAEAFEAWREVNAAGLASSGGLLAEARAALALGRVAEADRALARATDADPTNPEPWRLRLERLRMEDLALEALKVGWSAYAAVPSRARRGVLRDLTLALLADLPDDLARETLTRWANADPSRPDRDARVALLRRIAAMPRSGDPDRASRVDELSHLLAADPAHRVAREALVTALADSGEPERGRAVLEAWPAADRDARYWRLRGRWDLEYDRRPDRASAAFQRALADLPHDTKTRFRLSRALHALGREAEARREALAVNRTREALDPLRLGPRLASDLDRIADPAALADLADLCAHVGLDSLADAWNREAAEAREARQARPEERGQPLGSGPRPMPW
ncbi:MAG: hypothetical protein NVSMB9_24830 [Isosphaeraceae bacterium]